MQPLSSPTCPPETASLYTRAISLDLPIRTWRFTKYHPREASGLGGGRCTADGGGFRSTCIAASTRHYRFWRGHQFWVDKHGLVVVGDNGPGWSGRYQFDLPAWTAAEANRSGHEMRRVIVVSCPRPKTCSCDFAKALDKQGHRK